MIVLNQFIKAFFRFCLNRSITGLHCVFRTGNRLNDQPNQNNISEPMKHFNKYTCKFV